MNKTGFGFLRLPMVEESFDYEAVCRLTDSFLNRGGRIFDTCWTYLNGQSEAAIRDCLVKRYPRDSFELCDKLPGYQCHCYDDCLTYYQDSLQRCGVSYFDIYMLHGLNQANYDIAREQDQFRFLRWVKETGGARAIGFSYHDSASLLDEILTAHPETDVVLLQLNYLDWDSPGIEARKNYETCLRHGVRVMVMEPVKGGTLASLPEEAVELMQAAHPGWTPASWAIRFVHSLPGVSCCLSGMNAVSQIEENLTDFVPLTNEEQDVLTTAAAIIQRQTAIACTGCGYCIPHCPQSLLIPDYFRLYNELARAPKDDWKLLPAYQQLIKTHGRAEDCIACGSCQQRCPQKLDIPGWMKAIAPELGKNPY
ncbi:MAG: aldo/keto reductase [Oscillospiraceae bacterium]|nr:aldo/keto reductase [Oscillospiraceae bacterium]